MSVNNSLNEKGECIGCRDLESLLRKNFGDDLSIVEYSTDNFVPFGENFCSAILKISAEVRRNKDSPLEVFHFVAKSMPATLLASTRNVNWTCFYKKEIFMYTKIIPFYKKIEFESNMSEKESISQVIPQLCGYRMSLDPNVEKADEDAVILLENLNVKGYYIIDKNIGLVFQHAVKVIESLARFHALGIVANANYPSFFETIKADYSQPDYDSHAVGVLCDNFINALKERPCFDKYVMRVEAIASLKKAGWNSEQVTHPLWSTVIHYDFWVNNIMFHNDDSGNINNVKFIDFQTYCYADVFLDLCYFFFTSLCDEVKLNNLDELLDIYYAKLVSILKSLDADIGEYSKQAFNDRLKEVAVHELLHCAIALNFITVDSDANKREGEDLRASIMKFERSELYFNKVLQILQIYEERGWLPENQ